MTNMKPGQPRPRKVKHKAELHATLFQQVSMLVIRFIVAGIVVFNVAAIALQAFDWSHLAGMVMTSSLLTVSLIGLHNYIKWGIDD